MPLWAWHDVCFAATATADPAYYARVGVCFTLVVLAYAGERVRKTVARVLQIYVPRMYKQLSSEKVLTMEWVDGVKPRRGSEGGGFGGGSDQDLALVEVGVRCSLEQMLEEGCASALPHAPDPERLERVCWLRGRNRE